VPFQWTVLKQLLYCPHTPMLHRRAAATADSCRGYAVTQHIEAVGDDLALALDTRGSAVLPAF
jgi:hypothetical protein